MDIIPARPSFNFSPRLFGLTILLVLLIATATVAAAFKLNYLALDNGKLYFSPNRLIRVYGQVIDPAEIDKEEKLILKSWPDLSKTADPALKPQRLAEEVVIRQKIIAAEAAKRGITMTTQEIQTQLQRLAGQSSTPEEIEQEQNKTYNSLLEKKVRDVVEGKTVIQEITFWSSAERLSYIQDVAEKTKGSFTARKDFAVISKEAKISAASAGISAQPREIELRSNTTTLKEFDSAILDFFASLKEKEAKVLVLQNQIPIVVVVAFAKSHQEGPDFNTWYQNTKTAAIKY